MVLPHRHYIMLAQISWLACDLLTILRATGLSPGHLALWYLKTLGPLTLLPLVEVDPKIRDHLTEV
jgi:hypothetical protein